MINFRDFLEKVNSLMPFDTCSFIHCSTEKEALKLCEAFMKAGLNWGNGDSYIDNCFSLYGKNSAYSNVGTIYNVKNICDKTRIFEFKDIIF